MKKEELLKQIDNNLIETIFSFCYVRTNNSYEAQELCSDIIYELIKISKSEGYIDELYSFIWKVAKNVYADYSNKRQKHRQIYYQGNPDELFVNLKLENDEKNNDEIDKTLSLVYKQISFLSKAYREVMISYYLDGKNIMQIAKEQDTSENAIRQRLFFARNTIKSEVNEMKNNITKPISLDNVNFIIIGTGNPLWGDPRNGFYRQLSKHILYLCRKRSMSALEIAKEINVPTMYVEEELEILARGSNGQYGLLRKLENGKYIINFLLLEKDVMNKLNDIYLKYLPNVCNKIKEFIVSNKDEYMSFPYLNKQKDLNLILWQQIHTISDALKANVYKKLKEKYFSDIIESNRPFSVYGYIDNGSIYGCGWDGIKAQNICDYKQVFVDNIYISRIKKHFSCGHNIATDRLLQLAILSINGLDISSLNNFDKETAAKAIECGYLYKEDNTLYTKILVCEVEDKDRLFKVSEKLYYDYFEKEANEIAEKIYKILQKEIPQHLLTDWKYANRLANLPVLDLLVEELIKNNILIPPTNELGAEGCWMAVEK